jgi:RNase P subunit RPR2
MRKGILMALCFYLLSGSIVHAESYYLQAVKSTEISVEKLQKSRDKVKEHKDIKVQDELEIPPFHKRDEWEKNSLSLTFCTGCHLSPPHTKNLRVRAFLNMHTEFIACETCHLRPENVKFNYQWLDYRSKQAVEPANELFRQYISMDDIPKEAEEKVRKTDVMVKIVPFYNNELTLVLRDHDFAQKSLDVWKEGGFEEKVTQRAKIHVPLKEKGPECKACHQTEEPMLDLKALGANKRQARSMQKHIVPQFFKRYTEDDQKIKIDSLLK